MTNLESTFTDQDIEDMFGDMDTNTESSSSVDSYENSNNDYYEDEYSDTISDDELDEYINILQTNNDLYLELYDDYDGIYECRILDDDDYTFHEFDLTKEQYDKIFAEQHFIKKQEPIATSAYTSRFNAADWFAEVQNQEIILAGLGGIGSYVSFLLSRVSPKRVILYDDDIVEGVNISGQLYTLDSIGDSKADATAELSQKFSGYRNIISLPQRFTEKSEAGRVMICGFDSMTSRKIFYKSWKRFIETIPEDERHTCLFIDGRLAAESMQVFCFTGEDKAYMERYENEFMFSDEEAEQTSCSYKQTTFCANMIGSIIVNLFINFASNLGNNLMARSLPFLTEYDAHFIEMKNEF